MQYENSYEKSDLLKSHIRSSIEPIAFFHFSPKLGHNCYQCEKKYKRSDVLKSHMKIYNEPIAGRYDDNILLT